LLAAAGRIVDDKTRLDPAVGSWQTGPGRRWRPASHAVTRGAAWPWFVSLSWRVPPWRRPRSPAARAEWPGLWIDVRAVLTSPRANW